MSFLSKASPVGARRASVAGAANFTNPARTFASYSKDSAATSAHAKPPPSPTAATAAAKPARKTVLIDGTRVPFLLSGTNYQDLLAVDLARAAIHGLVVKTAFDPASLDGIIMGTVIQEGAMLG